MATGPENLSAQIAAKHNLPAPEINVDPSIRQQGYRGLYDKDTKKITISDPTDTENVIHETMHYVSDMETGDPLKYFACEDKQCAFHHPLFAQLARRI